MSLNKQKGNMYEFITHTWNPLSGECPHRCVYCSTNGLIWPMVKKKYSGPLRVEESYLRDDLGYGRFIFVCAQNDLFAESVDIRHIDRILQVCDDFPANRYLIQSKNPQRFMAARPRDNFIYGTTIETNRDYSAISFAPSTEQRATWMAEWSKRGFKTMVTIEPILDFDLPELYELVMKCRPEWVNIGADSQGNDLPEPDGEKVGMLKTVLEEHGVKVVGKKNLGRLLGTRKYNNGMNVDA